MGVFDAVPRTNMRPKRRREPSFGFLNRAAGPEYGPIRSLIESWYARYPEYARRDLRGRFRSDNESAHAGALFELIVHELLVRLGATVNLHPSVSSRTSRPDFHADFGGRRVYVEAVDTNPPTSLFAAEPLEDAVLDAIDELDSPNYFIHVETRGKLASAPSHKRVVDPFARLMEEHDPDDVLRQILAGGHRAAPSLEVTHGRWRLQGTLVPKSQRGNGQTRTIGIGPSRAAFVDSSTPVRTALLGKAGRYGDLDAPYIVAINAHDVHDRIDEMEALFGKERFTFRVDRTDDPLGFSREPDGVWIRGGYRPRYTRLAAVLLFRGIAPWSLRGAYACLYLNPYAVASLPPQLLRLAHAIASNGEMKWFDGQDIGELLDVPAGWPNQATA